MNSKVLFALFACATGVWTVSSVASEGLRGDPEAIADATAMVQTMGGVEIWSQMESLYFVHERYPWNRVDSYIEHEIIDLTGPRSRAERTSEINHGVRAYSPDGGRWNLLNGQITRASEDELSQDLARAPFNFYRLVKAVASNDPRYELKYGPGDIPTTRRLEFYAADGRLGGWIILNVRKEPIVKATPEYRYTLGPLKRFGNIKVPAWGVYDNGWTRYEMISLTGKRLAPDISIFLPPSEDRSHAQAPAAEPQEASSDDAVEFLLSAAAGDFHRFPSPDSVRFRNVRIGHVLTPNGSEQYMLCGQFQSALDGSEAEWTPFVTIRTSDYEQWIGPQAAGLCQRPSIIWDRQGDFSSSLQSRLDSLGQVP